eukprot:362660-Alexandrium_andersonii.AAC.1
MPSSEASTRKAPPRPWSSRWEPRCAEASSSDARAQRHHCLPKQVERLNASRAQNRAAPEG